MMNKAQEADIAFATVSRLGSMLRAGEVGVVELTKLFLDRLEKIGPKYNCVATLTRDQALAEANLLEKELKDGKDRGPLHGIPYGAKDLLATRGVPTTWGCAPYKSRILDHDSTVIVRMREAGAILAAKLSMVELAGGMGYRRANAAFNGPGLNPWNTELWAGGSSSGSGSAVAGGLVPFAIGTETWGSITTPSAFCGLTGLRPTFGRVSKAGAMALSYTLDKIGPMSRSAHDCGLVLNVIAGPDTNDLSASERPYQYPDFSPAQPPFRLGVIKNAVAMAQPEVRENFQKALDLLKTVATIEEVEPPQQPFELAATTILGAEMASAFEEMVESGEVFQLTAPEDRVGGFAEQAVLATEYLKAQRIRGRLCQIWDQWLAPYDAVLTAPVGGAPPKAEGEFGFRFPSRSLGGPGNLCGTPALVMPTGLTKEGLPTAIQLDGRAYSENRLIAVAQAFQNLTKHHLAHP